MLKKLLAVIMTLAMVISVASFRINNVEATGNKYEESRDVFVADCVINGLLDKSGNRVNTYSLISSTILHNYTYKALAEALMDDKTLVFNSSFWNTVNNSLKGDFVDVFQQRKLFYETILMDYLAYVDNSEEYKSSFDQDCAKYEYDISKKLVEVASKTYENNVDEIINNQSLSDAIEFSDKYGFIYQLNEFNGLVSSIKEKSTSAKEYYDALKSALAIKNANVSRIAFLKQMKSVASDNTDFCAAVDEIVGIYEGNYAAVVLDGVGITVLQHLTDKAWKNLLGLLPSTYSAVLETIKLGQKTLDYIFNSNDAAENNLKLLILYIIGNYARESATNLRTVFNNSQTASNGSDFVNGYLEYVIYQKYATELANGYVQESTYDGLWNQIKNSFSGTDTTYEQFKKYFEDDISTSKGYISQVVKYYSLHGSYYGDFFNESSEIIASGASGNMSWNLNRKGVLTISGTGYIPSYYYLNDKSWYKYRESIKQVKIGDGITGIGYFAFKECRNLTSVTISENVKSIENAAFSNCTSLTNITIPSSVTTIGSLAFDYCTSLISIAISNGVTSIEGQAFAHCTSLTSIRIPSSVASISVAPFLGCDSLIQIDVDSENPNFCSLDGILFNKSQTRLIECPGKKNYSIIPQSVTSIAPGAFSGCKCIKDITIPNSVKSIEYWTFELCESLTSITIPNSVTNIGGGAFSSCKSLKEIKLPDNLSNMGTGVFSGCTSLISVAIPNKITSIGADVFNGCTSLINVTIPNGVTSIGSYAFSRCESLTSITIPNSVTSIENSAFRNCKSLKELIIPEGVNKLGAEIIADTDIEKITIPSTVTHSDYRNVNGVCLGALAGDTALTEVEFAEGMTKIPAMICDNASSIEKIIIPSTSEIIENAAFSNCTNLKEIKLPDTLINIEGRAFKKCSNLTSVTIPGNVTSIGDYAFSNCDSLVANVYNNSTGLTYCKNNKIDYRIVGTYDESSAIQIESGTCTNIDESTELKVNQLKEGNDYDVVSKSFDNFELYDIAFYKDEEKVEVDGTAIVRIPVKEGMNGNKCKVYYNDNGTYTDMNAVYKDGYMEFKTDHFSQYIVTDSELPTTALGDVNEDGEINFLDAIMVLRYDAEIIELEESQLKTADVNGDGEVNFLDAIMILRYDAEIISSFN